MGRYVIRRLLYLVVVLLIVTMVTFLIFYVLPPTDPTTAFAGKFTTQEVLDEVRRQFGLDKPLHQQYFQFVRNLFLGDEYGWPGFGFSYSTRAPIKEDIFDRVGVTAQLAVGGALVWLLMGIPIGIISALKRRSIVDRAAMGFALFGVSAPVFWLGLIALFVFWQTLDWLPGSGYVEFGESPVEWFTHMIMPWFVLALLFAAVYARQTRSNVLETMSEDYIRTARAKGLPERKVIFKHALRASLTPIVTIFGLDLGLLLGGAVITESVFNLPGLGPHVIGSANDGDLPTILAITVFAAFFISILNLIVDIVYAYLDPRVRYS
ncbi:MAG TPA: ABC transporter permease [Actinomycetota bacterium]|nr:ABC transporter permease [Actinomycetota bacterium]